MPALSITDHLQALRQHLLIALTAVLVCAGGAFYFSEALMEIIGRSLPTGTQMVFLSPEEALWADLKLSLFVGLSLAFPIVAHQAWRFVAPGLLATERRHALPFLLLATFFFFLGLAFSYFVALPFALDFLIGYGERRGITAQISVSNYVDFHLKLMLGFGAIFELPAVMFLLARVGILTAEFLRQKRRYAIFLAFLVAAILTPTPDVFNQCLMAIPLIFLYEVGYLIVRIFGKRHDAPPPPR